METKELQAFTNQKFGTVRTVIRDGEPWFVAADICRALELEPTAVRRLDHDEVFTLRLTQGETSRTSDTNIVNESGLYSLILGSRKPEAHAFKRWVTHEVLPAIRRTGGYSARQGDAANELLGVIRQERERLDALERELRRVRPAPALHAGETRERLCEAADTFVAAVLEMTRSGELRVEPLDAPDRNGNPDGYEDEQYLYLRPSTAYGRYARRCEEYGTPRPDTQRSCCRCA